MTAPASAPIITDPRAEVYPPKLPADPRRQVIINGTQVFEFDAMGAVVKSYCYKKEMAK